MELLEVILCTRMHQICLLRNKASALVSIVQVKPFDIAGIIQRLARAKMNESYRDHEAIILIWIVLILRVKAIVFVVHYYLWIVPRNKMLKFYHGKQEE